VASNDRRCVNYRRAGERLVAPTATAATLAATAVCGVGCPRLLARICVCGLVRFRPEQICAVTDSVSEQQRSVRSISSNSGVWCYDIRMLLVECYYLLKCRIDVLLQSLKSHGYVKEQYAWRHYYWYLTNEGIQFLRDELHLPPEIVPATLKRQTRTETARPPRAKGMLSETSTYTNYIPEMIVLFIKLNTPRGARVPPFRVCSSLVHSLPHLLLFITFSLFSFLIHFTYFLILSIRSLSTSIVPHRFQV